MSSPALAIGVDLGGSQLRAGLVDDTGRLLRFHARRTPVERGPEGIVHELAACVRDACLADVGATVLGVGVGVAGQVDRAGVVRGAPNLAWTQFPFRARLEMALDLPVTVLNDVQAAAFGEHTFGAGQGVDDLVCLFIGTGVGGGVITRGALLQGCTGSAAELGHVTVDPNGPVCRCGNRGCLEAFAGGWAVARRARDALTATPTDGAILREIAGSPDRVTAATVVAAADLGDPLSQQILHDAGAALGIGTASIVNAFNPCLVVLGGGVMAGVPRWIDLAAQAVRSRALAANAAAVGLRAAALGPQAGVIGAAAWAAATLPELPKRPPTGSTL